MSAAENVRACATLDRDGAELPVRVDFEWHDPEPRSQDHPGCPAHPEVCRVRDQAGNEIELTEEEWAELERQAWEWGPAEEWASTSETDP